MIQSSGVWSCPTGPLSARLAGYSVGPPSRAVAEAQAWLDVVDVAGTVAVAGSERCPRESGAIPSLGGVTTTVLQVDDQDAHLLVERAWRKAGGDRRYWACKIRRRTVYLHRVILNAPPGMDVDHINGDPDDNRRCNLRLATRSQNLARKLTTPGPSGYRGVWWSKHRSCWRAGIKVDKKTKHIGYYDTREGAAAAYNEAALAQWGEFAVFNELPRAGREPFPPLRSTPHTP